MKDRASYTTEEKLSIVKDVFSRKRTIQHIAKEKGISPTLISLWKKQAEDAIAERFASRSKSRQKSEKCSAGETAAAKRLRNDARKAKIRATHLENSLKDAKKLISVMEFRLGEVLAVAGYKMVKVRRPRQNKQEK